ncbi:MAG: pantoate--beta-alanine ligase [Saprospiraceae bacterium]|nr:pantoate--beta-alanine ligase [Saprospiraceae bacterium]
MHVFTTVNQIQTFLTKERRKGRTIAFVPTLGALHQGHLTLMKHAGQLADLVVCSIFVNPTQFNEPKDLEKYPRPLREDIHLLTSVEVQVLFLPTDDEIYPPGVDLTVRANLFYLTEVMEGPTRPGHFEGVITVVKRLLDIVQPDYLIMGQKDYQQQAIIGAIIQQFQIPTKLVTHPTLRDHDGLALSSRNVRIDPKLRLTANILYLTLQKAKLLMSSHTPDQVRDICSSLITDHGFTIEYFAIVDGFTLQTVFEWADHQKILACVAAWLGDVRLIDNEILTF